MGFALGALFGLPTIFIIMQNFLMLGAMLWLYFKRGLGFDLIGWLLIHGTTEMFAIIISCACGFYVARHVMFPGLKSRLQALRAAGQIVGSAMMGVWIMLMAAGCLEGYGRQLITNTYARLGVGAFMLCLWVCYFCLVRVKQPILERQNG